MDDYTTLQAIWFLLISVLWLGYFVLEGFDFGVGMLMRVVGRNEAERRAVLHSIGPVWDGNEVWLLVAGGATFAAFPQWYATLFSGFYLALFLILVALIVRNVAFEFWGKGDSEQWRTRWEWAIIVGSFLPALLWGVGWANIVHGVPIDAHGEYTGTLFTLLNPYALLGGLATLSLFLAHGAIFLSLRTTAEVEQRARAVAARVAPLAAAGSSSPSWPGRCVNQDGVEVALGDLRRWARRSLVVAAAALAGRAAGAGLRRHVRRDRPLLRRALRRPLPARDGLDHERRVQPHAQRGRVVALHADGDDGRRRAARAGRAALPGLDLLGLPPPRLGRGLRRRAHAARPARRAHRRSTVVAGPPASEAAPRSARRETQRRLARRQPRPRARTWRRRSRSASSRRRSSSPRRRCSPTWSARVFLGGATVADVASSLWWLVAVSVARGLVAAGFEAAGRYGAARVMADLRERLVRHLLLARPGDLQDEQAGELAATAVQGVDALEAYFARYLPQAILVGAGAALDPRSGSCRATGSRRRSSPSPCR